MVRVLIKSSHLIDSSGNINSAMYPHLKKHIKTRELFTDEDNCVKLGANMDTEDTSLNIPNLHVFGHIDEVSARRAATALCYLQPIVHKKECLKSEIDNVDNNDLIPKHTSTDENIKTWNQQHNVIPHLPETNLNVRRRHSSQETESDCPDTSQLPENEAERRERRRQRNKLSARAYRDRKRSQTQDQDQLVATLEAHQCYLREKVRKLKEEKANFLDYLKSELNIDLPKEDLEVTKTTFSG